MRRGFRRVGAIRLADLVGLKVQQPIAVAAYRWPFRGADETAYQPCRLVSGVRSMTDRVRPAIFGRPAASRQVVKRRADPQLYGGGHLGTTSDPPAGRSGFAPRSWIRCAIFAQQILTVTTPLNTVPDRLGLVLPGGRATLSHRRRQRSPDGYTPYDLTEPTNTLPGFALPNAMNIGDTALMESFRGVSSGGWMVMTCRSIGSAVSPRPGR